MEENNASFVKVSIYCAAKKENISLGKSGKTTPLNDDDDLWGFLTRRLDSRRG